MKVIAICLGPNVRFHPIADLFPMMQGKPVHALVADIRSRYNAGLQADRRPRFVPFEGGDPVAFVLPKNPRRRYLNKSQRGMVMARVATPCRGWHVWGNEVEGASEP